MKKSSKLLSIFIAITLLVVGILPANFNVTYAANKKDDKAGLLEYALSLFILLGSLGFYALTSIVAGEPLSMESLIFNQYRQHQN